MYLRCMASFQGKLKALRFGAADLMIKCDVTRHYIVIILIREIMNDELQYNCYYQLPEMKEK